jgi:hypothetical protein
LCSVSCRGTAPLALLREAEGTVERDYDARRLAWEPAPVGAKFSLGDGIQTQASARALLALDDGAQLMLEPKTLIRFSDTPPAVPALAFDVELGAARLEASGRPVALQTRGGLARLRAGSRVILTSADSGVRFRVEVGQAVFGEAAPLEPGDSVLINARGQLETSSGAAGNTAAAALVLPGVPAVTTAFLARVNGAHASVRGAAGWTNLPAGSVPLEAGTALRVGPKTTIELQHGLESATLGADGRYVVAPSAGVLVSAQSGSIQVHNSAAVRIQVPGGVIVVAEQGEARIDLRRNMARVAARLREITLEGPDGATSVRPGETAEFGADGHTTVRGRSLDYADFELDAGETVTLHDPAPPSATRFRFGEICPTGGTIQILTEKGVQQYAVGDQSVSIALPPGSHRYELHCAGAAAAPEAKGRVVVLKDAGTRRLAKHPPAATLQADGRDYTVLYQNRLPDLNVLWPGAPQTADISLTHESPGKTETLSLDSASHTFTSGQIAEGRHVFTFTGGGKISRKTSVDVRFDNASPTASLNTPPSLGAPPGQAVQVSGTALRGWEVRVEGQRVATDAEGRFSQTATVPSERRALAVSLSHPERGTHVYLRRAQ